LDCRGADGTDGADGLDGLSGQNGIDGQDGADGADGAVGQDGADGLNCWDLNGNGLADLEEDTNGDGFYTALDCRNQGDPAGPTSLLFDIFIDDFFTVRNGTYGSLGVDDRIQPLPVEEPALGPTEVVAYRTVIPYLYDETGHADPTVDQNEVTMRMFFWREGPAEDCFVFRLDTYRAQHGTGALRYGAERFIRIEEPVLPDHFGTLVVVDLPLNNTDGVGFGGLGLPADLRAGDFLAFELNIPQDSTIDPNVSYTLMGVEFFETPADAILVASAKVFASLDDVDCNAVIECRSDRECDDGEFCNGQETCDPDGQCVPGSPLCDDVGEMCDEVDDVCVSCDAPIGDDKAVICHVPDTRPFDARTLVVGSPAAAQAHFGHGDSPGPCSGVCEDDDDQVAQDNNDGGEE